MTATTAIITAGGVLLALIILRNVALAARRIARAIEEADRDPY